MRDGFGSAQRTRTWVARQWRAELFAVQDRYEEALTLLANGVADAQRERQAFAFEFLDIWRGRALLQTGDIADAAAVLEGRSDAAAGAPVTSALYAAAVVALGRIAIHTGDERRKPAMADIARAMISTGTPANRRQGAWLLALLAAADGDALAARSALDTDGASAASPLWPLYPLDVTDEPHMVRIALAAGDPDLAASAAAGAEARATLNPEVASIQAAAAHARGLERADLSSLQRACELYASTPRRLAHASALEDLGVAAQRAGDAAGTGTLGQALELYTTLGATWDANRVRRRLRALGVRRRLVTQKRPTSGVEALSQSELAVADLVAQGMTNREVAARLFLSPHTVSSHLRHSFTKLGVNSRVELARALSGTT
jgi:DNA-binding CsgD family transcriptional regulator